MVRWAAATAVAAAGAFCAGFLFVAWCIGQGLKDGSLDDVVDHIREKYPR